MSNHTQIRDFRSEGIHFKNKYKFMILKGTMVPQIKEAFVGSKVNTKSTLQYLFWFCSDVSFNRHNIFKRLASFIVLTLLISDLKFMFLLLSLLVSVHLDISKNFFRIMNENNVHTKMCY